MAGERRNLNGLEGGESERRSRCERGKRSRRWAGRAAACRSVAIGVRRRWQDRVAERVAVED